MYEYSSFINGEFLKSGNCNKVIDPYDNSAIGTIDFADYKLIEIAIKTTCEQAEYAKKLPAYKRAEILRNISLKIKAKHEYISEIISKEAGKPISQARGEALRAVTTFAFAASEAERLSGELVPMDAAAGGEGRMGIVKRMPIGPIAAISPFNFPLNLVAHKVAPAIAAGNTVLLKPASKTPFSAIVLAEIAKEAGLPDGYLNVVPCGRDVADIIISDDRLKMITFTGSAEVGWSMKSRCGKKKITLELGGNAAAIVEPDCCLETAAKKLALGSFAYAGQICISTQRIFVNKMSYSHFVDLMIQYTNTNIKIGNTSDETVSCGPIIDEYNFKRVLKWIEEAKASGAKCLTGGETKGNIINPCILTGVNREQKLYCEEAFGPVVVVEPYEDFNEAIKKVNDSKFGLQAAIFTNDINKINKAFNEIETGGIIHGDYTIFRVDQMPYGGVKDSGFGREGLKYAVEEMTEPRLLVTKAEY